MTRHEIRDVNNTRDAVGVSISESASVEEFVAECVGEDDDCAEGFDARGRGGDVRWEGMDCRFLAGWGNIAAEGSGEAVGAGHFAGVCWGGYCEEVVMKREK